MAPTARALGTRGSSWGPGWTGGRRGCTGASPWMLASPGLLRHPLLTKAGEDVRPTERTLARVNKRRVPRMPDEPSLRNDREDGPTAARPEPDGWLRCRRPNAERGSCCRRDGLLSRSGGPASRLAARGLRAGRRQRRGPELGSRADGGGHGGPQAGRWKTLCIVSVPRW